MALKYRFLIFTTLWLVAGLVVAIFADFSVEAGDSEFAARASMVYAAPLYLAHGLAFVVVRGGYNAWQGWEFGEGVIGLYILAAYVTHAITTLSRRTRGQYIFYSIIQLVFLAVSVAACLYYWHWDALHMHG